MTRIMFMKRKYERKYRGWAYSFCWISYSLFVDFHCLAGGRPAIVPLCPFSPPVSLAIYFHCSKFIAQRFHISDRSIPTLHLGMTANRLPQNHQCFIIILPIFDDSLAVWTEIETYRYPPIQIKLKKNRKNWKLLWLGDFHGFPIKKTCTISVHVPFPNDSPFTNGTNGKVSRARPGGAPMGTSGMVGVVLGIEPSNELIIIIIIITCIYIYTYHNIYI